MRISDEIRLTNDISLVNGADIVIFGIPTRKLREVAQKAAPHMSVNTVRNVMPVIVKHYRKTETEAAHSENCKISHFYFPPPVFSSLTFAIIIPFFAIVLLISKYVSVASISAAMFYPSDSLLVKASAANHDPEHKYAQQNGYYSFAKVAYKRKQSR